MKTLITVLMVIATTAMMAQTIVKDVPIKSEYPYLIKVWAYDDQTTSWGWYEITETGNGSGINWYIERKIKIEVDRYDVFEVMFIRGMEQCADTTNLTIHGSYDKTVIKDKPDLRKIVTLDGGKYELGNKIERPE